MRREQLLQVIADQHRLPVRRGMVARDIQTRLDRCRSVPQVIIISGIRRSGKSTLLSLLRSPPADYYINFDDERLLGFTVEDFQLLLETFMELYGERQSFFFDEIQNVPGWERFVRRLHDEGKKVYLTGSNASLLSRELGTHLTGRYLELRLWPFSFREYLRLRSIPHGKEELRRTADRAAVRRAFTAYLEEGGFPEYLLTKNPDYLKMLYDSVIYRDIVTRYRLPSERMLKELVDFVASNVGKELSFNALSRALGAGSPTTIKEYFGYLENSFLAFLVPRYDASLKRQVYAPKKSYLIDIALARLVGFRTSADDGRLLENIVFLELQRQGKVTFFHHGDGECDFVVREGLRISQAIQVALHLGVGETRVRELRGLRDAMAAYRLKEGLLLTLDDEDEIIEEGRRITVLPVWKWLLGT